MQHDLFPRTSLSLSPEAGRSGPRLWVRKLVVWSEPGKEIRTIDLRPGLNVVWSPDAEIGSSDPIGHGGGKTTFCRMLRHCLGEDSFSPAEQRHRIIETFPDGMVGAEVMIEGICWAVVRFFGRRQPIVVVGAASLDDAFSPDVEKVDLSDFRKKLADHVIGDAGTLMPSSIDPARRWEAVLAWMTRDQECRLRHHFEWRDPDSDSRSPVGGRSKDDLLAILRAAIGALTTAEIEARARDEEQSSELIRLRAELGRFDWQLARVGAGLKQANKLGASVGLQTQMEMEVIKKVIEDRTRSALDLPENALTELEPARAERERAASGLREVERRQTENDLKIEYAKRELSLVEAQLPKASAELDRNRNPVCPICKVALDAALTEGCQLAKECDLDELQLRIAATEAQVHELGDRLAQLQAAVAPLKSELAIARQTAERADRTVSRLESALVAHSRALREANRQADEIERHGAMSRERDETASAIADLESELARTKQSISDFLASQAAVIRDLSVKFDGVVRELVPGNVSGSASLDRRGLSLKIEYGGNRSTAAIESWKVVAFDLAALAMTIEGNTRLPGLLLHDSPREADLGMSLYERLFKFIRKLEGVGPAPLFQYIVTTTTEPPKEFLEEPWLRLELKGAPAHDRFLRVDL
ncbi:UNVERIFIED_ORG: putative coiled-coil protein SlyX [Bradyrhizobium japonicum]|uniref:hypothetical protein n=1 Tax=Bradyrhizobium diazoefficiens TaxID=1355477 RepID=UPI00347C9CA0